MQYAFGDTELAARRLGMLAEVFSESSVPFLRRAARRGCVLAGDLGCGPGSTTRMLADEVGAARTVGLDASANFVRLASRDAGPAIGFHVHDVTRTPFPEASYDLLYCRFLLTHLRRPPAVLACWGTQLGAGGRLLVEETDAIETDTPAFARYVAIVEAMLAHQGHELYVAKRLEAMPTPAGLRRLDSRIASLPASDAMTAVLFLMNMRTWRSNAFVREHYADSAIDGLEHDLRGLAAGSDAGSSITWRLRQIAFQRV